MWFESSNSLIDGTKASRYCVYIFTCLWCWQISLIFSFYNWMILYLYSEVSNACICMFAEWLEFFLMSTGEGWWRRGTCLQYEEYNFFRILSICFLIIVIGWSVVMKKGSVMMEFQYSQFNLWWQIMLGSSLCQVIALLSLDASIPWFLCTKEVSFKMSGENEHWIF